jgi:hypothetical protein
MALLQALAGITTASAANPWLLKIEPGTYDVGATSFVMTPFVDVEGSGETVTKITGVGNGSNNVGTVQAVTNTELRFLTVENTGGAAFAKPLLVNAAAPRITHVTVLGSGGSSESQGFYAIGASPTVTDMTVSVTATGSAQNFAVANIQGSTSVFFNLNVTATGGSFCRAVANYDSTPTMRNVVAIATGAVTENDGVLNVNSSPQMENVVAVATGATASNNGVQNIGAQSAPAMRLVACRAIGATNINRGCANFNSAQPTMTDIVAEASGGQSAVAMENNGAGGGLSLTRVRAVASGASTNNWGLFNNFSSPEIVDLQTSANGAGSATAYGIVMSGSPKVSHATITAGGSTTGLVVGVQIAGAASAPTFHDAAVTASGDASVNVFGIQIVNSATPVLTSVAASAFGGAGFNAGVQSEAGTSVSLTNVTATASGSGTTAGISSLSSTLSLTNVAATANGSGTLIGLYNNSGPSTVLVNRSTLSGATSSITNTSGSGVRVAFSQLVGGPVDPNTGSITCLLSYSGGNTLLNPNCQ